MNLPATPREPNSAVEVALRRDEAGDRTAERNRSGILDALRAVAALMVLVDHTHWLAVGPHPGPVAAAVSKMLAGGIYLFFAVSGYLIAGPFLRALVAGDPLPRAAPYFVRRAARIYPGYWVALAVALVIPPAPHISAYQAPVHLVLLQSVWPHFGEAEALYPVAWTLGIEVVFYLLVPLAAALLRLLHPDPWRPGRLAGLVVGAGVAMVGWSYFVQRHYGGSTETWPLFARNVFLTSVAAFCPGMVIALAALAGPESRGWRWFKRLMARPWLCFPLAALLWGSAYAMFHDGSPALVITSPSLYYLACGLILGCCVVAGPWITWPVRVLAPVGLVSYGIYLWHATVIKFLYNQTSLIHGIGLGWLLDSLLVLAITLPIAALSWFGVERPLMRWAARWARRHTTASREEPPSVLGRRRLLVHHSDRTV
jgi:peptidoglycan/LPS O-acetylase OafA/YrhL